MLSINSTGKFGSMMGGAMDLGGNPGPLGRRGFLKCALASGAALGIGGGSAAAAQAAESGEDERYVKEARFYKKIENRKVECHLCPRKCKVGDKERGYCGVRENRDGTYYSVVYGRMVAAHVDPVEKKPLFHYLPGSMAFSMATAGCNVNCKFCQNWDISQSRPEQVQAQWAPPEKVAGGNPCSRVGMFSRQSRSVAAPRASAKGVPRATSISATTSSADTRGTTRRNWLT